MIVLFSPTKTQKKTEMTPKTHPLFLDEAHAIQKQLAAWNLNEIQENYRVSEKLSQTIFAFNQHFDLKYPAVFCYQGSGFKALNPTSWNDQTLEFAQNHMLIFSALYGVLKPLDAIGQYRLDFATHFPLQLYSYWQQKITQVLNAYDHVFINLASNEYSAMIDRTSLQAPIIDIDFKEYVDGTYITKATYSKVARGKLANIIFEKGIVNHESLKDLVFDGYAFNASLSQEHEYVFTR